LFYDKRLSANNTVSCGSCHEQAHGFAAPHRFSAGFQGGLTKRHAMALTDVRYNMRNAFFSDERVTTLEKQVLVPVVDSVEMGSPLEQVEEKLRAADFYPPLFAAAFGTPEITCDKAARALAQFLRSLISYRSKFDRAHYGSDGAPPDPDVFTAQEKRG